MKLIALLVILGLTQCFCSPYVPMNSEDGVSLNGLMSVQVLRDATGQHLLLAPVMYSVIPGYQDSPVISHQHDARAVELMKRDFKPQFAQTNYKSYMKNKSGILSETWKLEQAQMFCIGSVCVECCVRAKLAQLG